MKRIALFFGSFNPIHNGHIQIALAVLAKDKADEVQFVLTPHNPFKDPADLWPEEHRWAMLQEVLAAYPNMEPNDIELRLSKPNYTATTLEVLTKKYPNHAYSLLLGADSATSLPTWHEAAYIQQFPLLIYPRSGSTLSFFSVDQLLQEVPLQEISASQIRTTQDQALLDTWLPPAVRAYLSKHSLIIET